MSESSPAPHQHAPESTWGQETDVHLLEFVHVMRRLRVDCEWKATQTHRSLGRYLLEETHELLEALDLSESDPDDDLLREELGDVLLQVIFHATIAEQRGAFTLGDVAQAVTTKMIRRNQHVFGTAPDEDLSAAEITERWEQVKAQEKARTEVTDGLAPTLPGLLYADKVIDRAARAGTPVQVVADSPDLGERLLALVAEAHDAGVDPEQALRDTVRRHLEGRG